MQIIDYFESEEQNLLMEKIAAADWSAARFLVELLKQGTFDETLGGWGHLFLLMNQEELISFVTLTGQDSVRNENLTPWIGFVFTKPEYRGHHYAGQLLAHGEQRAADLGYSRVYIATDHVGLYEKYGYSYQENRLDCWGNEMRVLYKEI